MTINTLTNVRVVIFDKMRVDHKRRGAASVTCCARWRQRTPSCECSLEVLTCWASAAQRSCGGWTGRSSASRGPSSLWRSSVDLCSCAVCTSQSRSPPGMKNRRAWSVLGNTTLQMFTGLRFYLLIVCQDFLYRVHVHLSYTVVEATNTEIMTGQTSVNNCWD